GGGVADGAIRPTQASASTSAIPDSAMVGRSGSRLDRLGEVTASIRTLPSRPCATTEPAGRIDICTSPRISAVIAAGEPGNTTCTALVPDRAINASIARCDSEPLPIDP